MLSIRCNDHLWLHFLIFHLLLFFSSLSSHNVSPVLPSHPFSIPSSILNPIVCIFNGYHSLSLSLSQSSSFHSPLFSPALSHLPSLIASTLNTSPPLPPPFLSLSHQKEGNNQWLLMISILFHFFFFHLSSLSTNWIIIFAMDGISPSPSLPLLRREREALVHIVFLSFYFSQLQPRILIIVSMQWEYWRRERRDEEVSHAFMCSLQNISS